MTWSKLRRRRPRALELLSESARRCPRRARRATPRGSGRRADRAPLHFTGEYEREVDERRAPPPHPGGAEPGVDGVALEEAGVKSSRTPGKRTSPRPPLRTSATSRSGAPSLSAATRCSSSRPNVCRAWSLSDGDEDERREEEGGRREEGGGRREEEGSARGESLADAFELGISEPPGAGPPPSSLLPPPYSTYRSRAAAP